MNPCRVPTRVKLGSANSREIEQLGAFLDHLRERERAAAPVLLIKRANEPIDEKYDTRQIVTGLLRVQRKGRLAAVLAAVAMIAVILGPIWLRMLFDA